MDRDAPEAGRPMSIRRSALCRLFRGATPEDIARFASVAANPEIRDDLLRNIRTKAGTSDDADGRLVALLQDIEDVVE